MNGSAVHLLTLASPTRGFGPNIPGLIWKDGKNNLHVSLRAITGASERTCICGLCKSFVEDFESWANELKNLFSAKAVIIHDEYRSSKETSVIEINSGYSGRIRDLPGSYEGDPWCGTHPTIPGVVSWVHNDEEPYNK